MQMPYKIWMNKSILVAALFNEFDDRCAHCGAYETPFVAWHSLRVPNDTLLHGKESVESCMASAQGGAAYNMHDLQGRFPDYSQSKSEG